jgi:hypothetical protein
MGGELRGVRSNVFLFSRKEKGMIRNACVFGLAILLSGAGVVKAATLWSDGFESGNLNGWVSASGNWAVVTSPQTAHAGTKGLDIKGNTAPDEDVLSVRVSSTGYRNLEWKYWYKVRDGLDLDDSVSVEWTGNGTTWQPLVRYSGAEAGDWQLASFVLPNGAVNNPNLGLRLRATLSSATDRMNFDDFALSGTAVPEPAAALSGVSLLSLLSLRRRRRK